MIYHYFPSKIADIGDQNSSLLDEAIIELQEARQWFKLGQEAMIPQIGIYLRVRRIMYENWG